MSQAWRRCSSCKEEIAFGAVYWVCSVSTCNRKRTGLAFCTTECWDAHLGFVNHRESWAVEERAPTQAEAEVPSTPRRRSARSTAADASTPPKEVLIVASKLKAYIRERAGFNTSDRVLAPLSDAVRRLADRAIENARRAERKTVLDRDFES